MYVAQRRLTLLPLRSRTSHELTWIDLHLETSHGLLEIQEKITCTLSSFQETQQRGTMRRDLIIWLLAMGSSLPWMIRPSSLVNLLQICRNLSSLSEHKLEGRKPEKNSVTYFGHQMSELSPFQTSKIKPPGKEFSALIYSDLWRLWLCLPRVVLQSGSRSGFLVKGVKEQKTMRICLNQDENLGRWSLL